MSRVAKAPIILPNNVELVLTSDSITVKGPHGSLAQKYNGKLVNITIEGDAEKQIKFSSVDDKPEGWVLGGTIRALVNNMIKGVTAGFTRILELVGVGYRAEANAKNIKLSLGFSHNIEYALPENVSAETPNNTTIVLKSIDKQLVGQVASEIRAFRPPEPYKGKGVKYAGEVIARKDAKKK